MDCLKVGALIKSLRLQKGFTQKQLADMLYLSDKTISKWECGKGCPDVAILFNLSKCLEIDIERILNGEIEINEFVGGNMKKNKYYICQECGNISICTGDATVSCCGRPLVQSLPQKALDSQKLLIEEIEDDWYITSNHPMEKNNFISFVAFATGDKIQVIKLYPEWNLEVRIQKRGHGLLLWYSTSDGLLYQLL